MDLTKLTMEETQNLPGALLWRTSKLWQSTMHAALVDLGLSSTNALVLSNIRRLELGHEKITQARVAALCNIDRMTASIIIRALTAKGLVERKIHDTDKRGLELTLTPEGREIAHEALRRIADMHQKFFESLTQQQITQLSAGLTQLLTVNSTDNDIPEIKNKEKQ